MEKRTLVCSPEGMSGAKPVIDVHNLDLVYLNSVNHALEKNAAGTTEKRKGGKVPTCSCCTCQT